MVNTITSRVISGIKDLSEISSIIDMRVQVFSHEQGFPLDVQTDAFDLTATHIEMFVEEKPAGAARIFTKEGKLVMGRFLVLKEYRSLGLGRRLMDLIAEESKKSDFDELTIYAQHQVVAFYERCGAKVVGEMMIIADYPHVPMTYPLK